METNLNQTAVLKSYRRRQILITLLPALALAILMGVFVGVVKHLGYRLDIYWQWFL